MNFKIKENEIVALLGKNGAGKTTTIRLLLGIIKPDQGKISYGMPDFNKRIGAQLQTTPFFEALNIIDNLKLFATFYDVSLSKNDIEKLLKEHNLYEARKTKAAKLSLGQQKRLTIIITTIHQPDLVILDEPSAGLDPSGQRDVQQMIQRLKQEGKSVLFASHDMIEIKNTADRVMLLHEGRILESGAPDELMTKYHVTNLEELFYTLTNKEADYV
ncbi:ABC transporter ATP-binding protein [Streptococcus dentiloxodontae]